MLKNGFDLRSEDKNAIHEGIRQRVDAERIACNVQLILPEIENRQSKLPIQMVEETHPIFFIKMGQHFTIAPCPKVMAFCHQLLAQFGVIENLSIANGYDAPVFAEHGLIAACEID